MIGILAAAGKPYPRPVSVDLASIERFAEQGDVAGCVEALLAREDRERSGLGTSLSDLLRRDERVLDRMPFPGSGIPTTERAARARLEERLRVLRAALLCVGTHAQVRSVPLWRVEPRLVARIMDARRPEWLQAYVDEQCPPGAGGPWAAIDELASAGLISVTPAIAASVPGALFRRSPEQALRERRWLLDAVWLLFEVEGGGESSLAAADKYAAPGHDWQSALLALVADGTLERQRVLVASLAALDRGFAPFRAGWFLRFHEALAPTVDERAELVDRYLRLLAAPQGPTQSFALKAVEVLARAGQVPPADLVEGLRHVVTADAKGTAGRALKLLDRTVGQRPDMIPAALEAAAEALVHASPDVQAAALDLLERHPAATASDVVRRLAPHVAASNRARAAALVGGAADAEAPSTVGPVAVEEPRQVEAIGSVEGLVSAIARALESPEDVVLIEQVVDGISRLCGEEAGAAGPAIARRARTLLARRDCPDPTRGICELALSWIERAPPPTDEAALTIAGFLRRRVLEVAARAARTEPTPLLAAPTHEAGWVDPAVAVHRVGLVTAPGDADAIQLLLRLGRDGRSEALAAAQGIEGELGAAIRHALGGTGETIGPSAPLWIAAARARGPRADDPVVAARHRLKHPDAAYAARSRPEIDRGQQELPHVVHTVADDPPTEEIDGLMPTVLFRHRPGRRVWWEKAVRTGADNLGLVRWIATVWPQNLDPFLEAGIDAVGRNLDWWEAQWHNRGYLEPLLDPSLELTQPAYQLLSLGLAAKDPTESAIAVDALCVHASTGRLEQARLGDEVAGLVSAEVTKPARIAAALGRAAAAHPDAVAAVVVHALRPDQAGIRGMNAVLQLLHETLVGRGRRVERTEARAALEAITGNGKAAQLARALLAL